ncbi:MAG: hypothetical protein DRJ52_10100, partial [Thermoprotei archaeon]
MALRIYFILIVIALSMFSNCISLSASKIYLKVIVGTAVGEKVEPRFVFEPWEMVYVLCEYSPICRKYSGVYYWYFNYSIEVLDPVNRRVFYKNGTVRKKAGLSSVWRKVFSFQVRNSFYNGLYVVKVTVYDYYLKSRIVETGYFAVVNSIPPAVTVKVHHLFRLGNPHKKTIRIDYLYIALITSNVYQKVLEGPVFSKSPVTIESDEYGNRYAIYRDIVLAPGEKFTVSINYTMALKASYINLNISRSELEKIPENIKVFLEPSPRIESDHPLIKSKAQELTSGKETLGEMLYAIGSFVDSYLEYTMMKKDTSALQAYLSRRGDCSEFSMLFTALARASGIPCRVVSGYAFIYFTPQYHERNITVVHAWCEVYVPGVGWILIEPQAPNTIGSTAPSGYYVVLCRSIYRETTVYGNKIRVRMLNRVYSGLYSTVHYSIKFSLVEKEDVRIKVTSVKYSGGYVTVLGLVDRNVSVLKAIVLKPDNSTEVADVFIKNQYFSFNYRAYEKGLYRICFLFEGDEKYRESFVEVGALAEKEEASIEAYVDKQKVVKGERIKIT